MKCKTAYNYFLVDKLTGAELNLGFAPTLSEKQIAGFAKRGISFNDWSEHLVFEARQVSETKKAKKEFEVEIQKIKQRYLRLTD